MKKDDPASTPAGGEASTPLAGNSHPKRSGRRAQPELERRYALWDELSDFGAQSTDHALKHCMKQICAWIGAQNAFWIGMVRMAHGKGAAADLRSGWRIGAIESLTQQRTNPRRMRASRRIFNTDDPGQTSVAVLAGAGAFRVHSLGTRLVDLEAFRQTDHYDFFYRQPGISDRIWVVFPVNADTESCFCFDKYGKSAHFPSSALETAGEALRGIKWFHRQVLLSHGLGAGAAAGLSPAERRVLRELLSGAGEKAIAERLGLTQASAHRYVTVMYRKFGVRGRAELMSLWLNSHP